jgi:hypothetical protein
MEITTQKKFEKPDGGAFAGTIIDVVNLPNVSSVFNGVVTVQNKIRIVWVIGGLFAGQKVLDSEGKPYHVIGTYNAKMIEKPKKSRLFELLEQVLNGAPPLITNDTDLERVLLGRSNQLFLVKNPDPKNPQDYFINVAGVSPLPQGVVPPPVPAGFVRSKDRPKMVAGVQTYATPQAAQAAATVAQPTAATVAQPATTAATVAAPSNNVAF